MSDTQFVPTLDAAKKLLTELVKLPGSEDDREEVFRVVVRRLMDLGVADLYEIMEDPDCDPVLYRVFEELYPDG
jgi:hypothetical protein